MTRTVGIIIGVLVLSLSASAWQRIAVQRGVEGRPMVEARDINGDGHLDLLVTADDLARIGWYENVGGYGVDWTLRPVASGVLSYSADAADLDGDGDTDIVATLIDTSDSGADPDILWWENVDGAGTQWFGRVIATDVELPHTVIARDINADGHIDLVISSVAETGARLSWWANAGGGLIWTETTVRDSLSVIGDHTVADIDGDGHLDIAALDHGTSSLRWWRNDAGDGSAWTETLVDNSLEQGTSVTTGDLNGDGQLDLVTSSFESCMWFANDDGAGSAWTPGVISGPFDDGLIPWYIGVADFDNDGDLDVVTAIENTVQHTGIIGRRINMSGDGSVWSTQQMSVIEWRPTRAIPADLNGDGLVDVLASVGVEPGSQAMAISWWKQPNGEPVAFTVTPIGSTEIPAEGGTLTFEAELASFLPNHYNMWFWTRSRNLDTGVYSPILISQPFGMRPFFHTTATLTQAIPASLPAGTYALHGFVAQDTSAAYFIDDDFIFTKAGAAAPSPGDIEAILWPFGRMVQIQRLAPDDEPGMPSATPFQQNSPTR